jgi:hypothetical protein
MAELYESLNEVLDKCPLIYSYAHLRPEYIHSEPSRNHYRIAESVKGDTDIELGKNEIEHGLNSRDLRTLFKILAKELPNCGRKRGAILRYIKAYTEEENTDNRKLYNILINNET